MTKVQEQTSGRDVVGVVVCTVRVMKMKENLPFYREPSILCTGIELLLTALSRFEREAALKDSAL